MKQFSLLMLALVLLVGCKSKYPDLSDGLYADVQTNKGDILLQLEFEKTPNTVANFVSLAEGNNPFVDSTYAGKRYYDGIIFHRVVKDFVIQGGDPDGNGRGGPGYKFEDEFVRDLRHSGPGILSMANGGPNTNGSQFFITHRATPHLDDLHSVFGHVVKGQEVVDTIAQNDTIIKVDIIRKGSAAKKFDAVKTFTLYFEEAERKQNEKEAKAKEVIASLAAAFQTEPEKAEALPSGLKILMLKDGGGEKPKTGEFVSLNYAGYFMDGTLFDSCQREIAETHNAVERLQQLGQRFRPMTIPYSDEARVIPGFKEGVQQLKVGDKARIFIPSHLAYGENGAGNVIPPNADLVFDIEILDKKAAQ